MVDEELRRKLARPTGRKRQTGTFVCGRSNITEVILSFLRPQENERKLCGTADRTAETEGCMNYPCGPVNFVRTRRTTPKGTGRQPGAAQKRPTLNKA